MFVFKRAKMQSFQVSFLNCEISVICSPKLSILPWNITSKLYYVRFEVLVVATMTYIHFMQFTMGISSCVVRQRELPTHWPVDHKLLIIVVKIVQVMNQDSYLCESALNVNLQNIRFEVVKLWNIISDFKFENHVTGISHLRFEKCEEEYPTWNQRHLQNF